MAAFTNFRIFPSTVQATEIDLSKPQLSTYQRRSTELKGVDFSPAKRAASPAPSRNDRVMQRSQSPSPQSTYDAARVQSHQRKRSSVPDLRNIFKSSDKPSTKPALALRIPSSTYSVSTYSEALSSMKSTPATATTAVTNTPQTDYSSINSAASSKASNNAFPPRSHSLRSNGTAVSKNFSKVLPVIPASPQDARDNRSIFPQYDSTKPLSRQKYYPPPTLSNSTMSAKQTSHTPAPPLTSALKRKDSAIVLNQGYECLPEPDSDDLKKLWSASTRLGACGGRKTHLLLQQPTNTTYTIGNSTSPFFSVDLARPKQKDTATQLAITKSNPQTREAHILANMLMPIKSRSQASYGTDHTQVFPHQAAVDALTAASNSPQAHEIARVDPRAVSRAAETLAKEAVNDSHRLYTSELIRRTRRGSSSHVDYTLQHSLAGNMTITVDRPSTSAYTAATRMKIALHHPSATPAAIEAGSLAILSLDFGRHTCVIDLPSILSLETDYMLDTAIAAVFATMAMEQEDVVPPTAMVFAAPPTKAVNDKAKKVRSKLSKSEKSAKGKDNKSKSGFWPLRKTGVTELDERVDDMPPFAKTAVAAVELGLHGAFFLLEKGAKALDERGHGRL